MQMKPLFCNKKSIYFNLYLKKTRVINIGPELNLFSEFPKKYSFLAKVQIQLELWMTFGALRTGLGVENSI